MPAKVIAPLVLGSTAIRQAVKAFAFSNLACAETLMVVPDPVSNLLNGNSRVALSETSTLLLVWPA